MDITLAIQKLEKEWDYVAATGFFARLRYESIFDETGFQRVKNILISIEIAEDETFDKRLVEVTWFIPVFMFWQREAWVQDGINVERLDEGINILSDALTGVLGLP